METLRLHAPIPGLEPRITPAGGCTLAGYDNIPGNVRVSAMPYALHRNGDVFPDPGSWRPERWLQASEAEMKEMLRWFWAFGSGGRMCIGSNLAMQEMKLIVTAIYTNWRTAIVDDDGIDEIDAYTTRPRSNRLLLRFQHV
jgi:cytochrome P450